MSDPLLLYSTNTWLAYSIAERYYGQIHYAWCSPFFLPPGDLSGVAAPPTAIPGEIYENLWRETSRGERHSSFIERNRLGILRGAEAKVEDGVVDEAQQAEISAIVELAQPQDFMPILYVIPYDRIADDIEVVPPDERAHPLSEEFRLTQLARGDFDALKLRR